MNKNQPLTEQQLKQLVLSSFLAEKNCDIVTGLKCIDEDYRVTEMTYSESRSHFQSLSGKKLRELMEVAYAIEGRSYEFKSIIADKETQTVIVEFIESYPDPKTGQIYRTPQISVCIVKQGKIFRTRHYMDPRLLFANISEEEINKAFL